MKTSMKNLLWLLLVGLALCVLKAHAQQGTNSGTIMLESSGGTITSRRGCSETLQCTGIGTRMSWRRFRIRQDLVNNTEYYIVLESVPVEGDTTGRLFQWQSNLVFPDLDPDSSNLYTCNVFDDTIDSVPQLVSVQLDVNREPVVIEPAIDDKIISSYYVGDTLLVGCPVQTCASGITVQFLFNDTIVATGMPSSTDEQVYTMNLLLSMESAGMYTCRVITDTPSYLVLQSFNITGTPMIRPTSSPGDSAPLPAPASPSLPPGVTSGPSTTQGNGAAHIGPTHYLPLLLILAALLCVYRS
ncbi:uncharacterized protein LOC135339049 [Halichondria panicea]|uniref:uncharacterized protein LOC135339049 n=1 Tax=Halichondria panicea TaxID=6063 RepID=UPI00312B308C